MADLNQLPFLLKLIDDTSPQVRTKVAQELLQLGPAVRNEIHNRQLILTPVQQVALDELLPVETTRPEDNPWLYWMSLPDEYEKLEAAFSLLAQWQRPEHPGHLTELLDELAQDFWDSRHLPDSQTLSTFLFDYRGFEGIEPQNHYQSLNSNLVAVIESRRGLPISLASIFMLVGKRLGLEIYGCNFPGHFLARAREGDRDLVFDCFNGGRILPKSETEAIFKAAPLEMSTPASAVTMIARVLSNMAMAFDHEGDRAKMQFILTLLSELHEAIKR